MSSITAKEKIKAELFELRNNALTLAQKNKALALKNPTFNSLDRQERLLILEISKLEAENKNSFELQNKLNNIKKEKLKVLKSLNLSAKDLEPQFSCKRCNDTGITSSGMCSCFKEKLSKYIVPEKPTKLATFAEFSTNNKTNEEKEKLEKLKNFLIAFSQGKQPYLNILFSGHVGVGKTFLAECTLSEFKKQNKTILKISAFAMNELFTKFHTSIDYSKQDYLDAMLACDVLLIDDLGTEPIKRNITREYLYLLLNERTNANKITIITTNLNMDEILAIYHERIFSRLANKKTTFKFNLEGKDLRIN